MPRGVELNAITPSRVSSAKVVIWPEDRHDRQLEQEKKQAYAEALAQQIELRRARKRQEELENQYLERQPAENSPSSWLVNGGSFFPSTPRTPDNGTNLPSRPRTSDSGVMPPPAPTTRQRVPPQDDQGPQTGVRTSQTFTRFRPHNEEDGYERSKARAQQQEWKRLLDEQVQEKQRRRRAEEQDNQDADRQYAEQEAAYNREQQIRARKRFGLALHDQEPSNQATEPSISPQDYPSYQQAQTQQGYTYDYGVSSPNMSMEHVPTYHYRQPSPQMSMLSRVDARGHASTHQKDVEESSRRQLLDEYRYLLAEIRQERSALQQERHQVRQEREELQLEREMLQLEHQKLAALMEQQSDMKQKQVSTLSDKQSSSSRNFRGKLEQSMAALSVQNHPRQQSWLRSPYHRPPPKTSRQYAPALTEEEETNSIGELNGDSVFVPLSPGRQQVQRTATSSPKQLRKRMQTSRHDASSASIEDNRVIQSRGFYDIDGEIQDPSPPRRSYMREMADAKREMPESMTPPASPTNRPASDYESSDEEGL